MTIVSRMLERSHLSKGCDSSPTNFGLPTHARRSRLTRIVFLWNAALQAIAPLGYEDEIGFHYGPTPFGGTNRERRPG
jgi:hypothetical protein